MKIKNFSLTKKQITYIVEQSAKYQTSESEILRRLLDKVIDENDKMLQVQIIQEQKSQESGTDD